MTPLAADVSWVFPQDVFTPVIDFLLAVDLPVAGLIEAAVRKRRYLLPLGL